MKCKILIATICINIFFLVSCGGVTPVPTSKATNTSLSIVNTATSTIIYPTVTKTTTPYPTTNPELIPTVFARMYPTIPVNPNYPTAEAPAFSERYNFYQTGMYIQNLYFGKYIVRKWSKSGESGSWDIVTISALNQPQVEINVYGKINIHYISGTDVTGNGTPDLILETAYGTWEQNLIYDLGDTPILVFDLSGAFPDPTPVDFKMGEAPKFIDIDKNGSLEYLIDPFFFDSMDIDFCIYPKSVVFEYDPRKGKYINAIIKYHDYLKFTSPAETVLNDQFHYAQEKYFAYCNLAYQYAIVGDSSTALSVLNNNLEKEDAMKAWNLIAWWLGIESP